MRVAIFFDGKNFYAGWRASNRPRIDFPLLARWIVDRVGGASLWGAHYYTAIERGDSADSHAQDALRSYLDMLDVQPGYFVHRFGRKPMGTNCTVCGAQQRTTPETAVDTAIAANAVRLAAIDAYDILVLVSGDGDHVPIIEAVRSLGKQAYVATWGRASLSKALRLAAFDHIDFLDGVGAFIDGGEHGTVTAGAPDGFGAVADPREVFLQEVQRAQDKFEEGYVGLHYFLTRWKSDRLDPAAEIRRRTLDEAVEHGIVEIYDAPDGAKAVRAVVPPAKPAVTHPEPGAPPATSDEPKDAYDFGDDD